MSTNVNNINTWITQINNDFKAAVSVDCVIFGFDEEGVKILLSRCDMPPFEHELSLLGDIVNNLETTDEAALRVIQQKTGLDDVYLEQVQAFSHPQRHPLGRVITIAYYSLVILNPTIIEWTKERLLLDWKPIKDINSLAFDHLNILETCFNKLKQQLKVQPIGFNLLPKKFTLLQLQMLYESILEIQLDKRNFRRKLFSFNVLKKLNDTQLGVSHRPANYYTFDTEAYEKKRSTGFVFNL